jgi:hypothetical protein
VLCEALPIKESVLEEAFVRTLNGIIQNRDGIMAVVGDAVNEALAEAGEDMDNSGELREVDGQIEVLQARILELNKQRTRREIDAERYNAESREVMAKLDTLFIERDAIEAQKSTATLSQAYQAIISEFLSNAATQAEFDKDIFTRLVEKIVVKNRDNIIFVLKDGTEVKADLRAAE